MLKKQINLLLFLSMVFGILLINITLGPKVALAADFTVQQWQVSEITLTSSITYADPFQNVDVTATFTGPGGKVITRPAFWDGGNTWKVRFAPTLLGLWTMTTSSTDSSNSGLHNITKTVQSNAYTGSHAIYQKGFLKNSENNRNFTYADGTPFFYLGDTHWVMPHEKWATSNAPGVPSQFKYTVDKRVSQGFTVYQSEPIWQPHGGGTHSGADEELVANMSDGMTSADLAGYINLDRKFKYIADQGLVHANAQVTWSQDPANFAVYTDAYMSRVAKYWVARYGAYPVIWTIAQEVDKNMYQTFTATTISKWYSVGQSLMDNDSYNHPILPHMENTSIVLPATSWWADKPYHEGWAVQWIEDMRGMDTALAFWNSSPTKPSVIYESYYDQFWTDSRGALGAAYKSFQYGMYGYGYGVGGVWNDLYSKPNEPMDFGTEYRANTNYYWWYDGANIITGDQLTYFKNFYTSLEWWKLVPRFDNAIWGSFPDPQRSLLSTDKQNTFVVFFFGAGTTTGTLKNMAPGSTNDAQWFNPRTGVYTNIGSITPTGSQWTIPARPTAEDWVLLVKKTSGGDVTNPNTITNLSISSLAFNSATLNWTAPGDDGSTGTAASYDIRYSTSPITSANWASAIQITGETAPVAGGTSQSFTVVDLNPSTTYYFAIKTSDEATNEAGLSNVQSGITAAASANYALGKTYSSSSIYGASQTADKGFDGLLSTSWQAAYLAFANEWLEVDFGGNTTFNSVVLTEYGNRTLGYRIEYWNGTSWLTAYTGTTIPNGIAVYFPSVTGSKARVYFTSGTAWSPMIYEFEIYTTGGAGDTTAPAAVTNLSVGSLTANSAALSWTAPGDDGNTGTASSYDIRYSTAAITTANWASATQAVIEPTPAVAGTNQSFTVTGLSASTTYYFAIKALDEVSNTAGLSNVPSGTTIASSDSTPPAAVTNLAVSSPTSSAVTLNWTSPGDDGSAGTAASYDIRYSTTAITTANWASASQAAGEPAPAVAGSNQSFTVTGLSASTTYYFAIKASDEASNIAGLSNVPSGTTTATASNLALGKTYSSSSNWDTVQTANKAFDGSLTTNWQSAYNTFANEWLQVDFGVNTTFNGVVLTEYGNRTAGYRIEYWNGTSWLVAHTGTTITNGANVTFTAATGSKARIYFTSGANQPIIYEFEIYNTGGTGDTTAPAAVTNLVVSSPTSSAVTLNWTSPGDDGSTGAAASYDIRYSTAAITTANWASATQATGEPAPAVAGTSQSFTVTGLSASTTYYFAIKASDEVPNIAGLSNVPSGTTTAGSDTTAPAAVTNLAVSSPTSSAVTLSWTSPGDDGSTGTAASYDIRYSTVAITTANWASATQATGEPVPAVAGTSQSFTVTGLSASTTYYFAIKASDEVPNIAGLSNVPSGTTTAGSANLALGKTYSSSSNWDTVQTANKAFDGSLTTNWQAAYNTFVDQWLEVGFGVNTTFNKVVLTEYGNRTAGYRIEYWNGTSWLVAHTGTTIANGANVTFTAVTGSKARIYFTSGTMQPIIYEFEVYNN